jgi:phage repressor protein C with HTH and peptisase S24 domain
LNEILNGKRNVTLELTTKICEIYKANPSFLMLGQHPLFINPEEEVKDNITHVSVKAQAGYGGQLDNPNFEQQLHKFHLPGNHFHSGEYRCFEIEGDSMHPTYQSGDEVVCSYVPNVYFEQLLKNMQTYIVITEHDVLLKRIINNIKNNKSITLISDNDSYAEKTVSIKEIKEIWKVNGMITSREFKYY